MEDNCVFCNGNFKSLSIKDYNNWDLQLFRDDQYYLGRSVAVFQNRNIEDICELDQHERDELFDVVVPEWKEALDSIFEPDMYNYASLGNDCRHLHLHIIPRYKGPREFASRRFVDEYWNQTYSQNYNRVILDEDERSKLIELIEVNLP